MAKIRKDYENSWWPRFLRWLKGGSTQLDDSMQRKERGQHLQAAG